VKNVIYILFLSLFLGNSVFAQTKIDNELILSDTTAIKKDKINPLAPAKAAFYSAIVPGLGQAYNKKYWKIPIVYGALGSGIYFYSWNNKKYHQYRDAYKKRLANESGGGLDYLDNNRLIAGQKFYQKNRDLSLLVTVGLYILNIVDANVDAHLIQFNVNDNLSVKPDLQQDDLTAKQNLALTFTYNF
jgi:hypothetical protein